MLNLLLLEATLDDQSSTTVDRSGRSHLSKHVLNNVLRLPVHSLADIGHVREDCLLVTVTHDLGRRNRVPLATHRQRAGVLRMELSVEPL